jgi:hypothetical protein
MRHVPGEASFEAEASDQSRWCAGTGRRWTGTFAGGRIRIRSSDRRRSAISKHHTQSTLRSWRRGNGRRESCDIPPLRQGKRHRRLHAGGARLRLRWMPWLWRGPWLWRRRWMSWFWRWRWMSRLWLQRLRLWRLRRLGHFFWRWLWRFLGRLWLRRLLRIVGCLPFVLSRCNFLAHRQKKEGAIGRVRQMTRPIVCATVSLRLARTTDPRPAIYHSALSSSPGTSPNFLITLASLKPPVARYACAPERCC